MPKTVFQPTALKATASAAAIAAWLCAAPAAYAQSTCDDFNPMTGDTVVCTFGSDPGTNDATPITMGINAPSAENVDLTVIDTIFRGFSNDAVFSGGTPTIALGGGSSITVRNASVSNLQLLEEGTLAFTDFGQVFQEPYSTLFDEFTGLFAGGAMPTTEDAQQVLDDNNINFTIDPTNPLGIEIAFAAAFTDAGVPTRIELDDDGDPVLIFGEGIDEDDPLQQVFGFPVQGEALDAINTVITDSSGSVITLGAPGTPVDASVITQIRNAPGTGGALAAGQNGITLGNTTGDDGDIFAIGASAIELAAGSVTRFTSNGDGIGVIGNDGAGIILNAGAMNTSAVEVVLAGGAEIVVFGEDTAAVRVNGDNAVVGLSSNFGGVATLGSNSPLFAMTGGNSVFNATLTESGASPSDEFDFDASFITFGNNSPLFQFAGDTSTFTVNADNIGRGTSGLGFISTGEDSHIFDLDGGSVSITNILLTDSLAQTSGDGSSIVDAVIGENSSTTLFFNGSELQTTGANAAALNVGPVTTSSVLNVTLTNTGSSVRTEGNASSGIILSAVSGGSAVSYTIDSTSITTLGNNSDGLQVALDASGSSASTFTLMNSTVETSGNFSHGAVFTSAFGPDVDVASNAVGDINGTSTITTSGLFSNALVVGENVTVFDVALGLGAIPSDGAAKLVVDTFEDFTATGQGGRGVQNNGTIEVIGAGIAYSAGKTGRIANAGTINGADGTAVTFAGDTDDIFELQPTGITIGNVDGAGGTDTFILGGEGTDTFDTDLLDTQYVNFEIFEKEDLSTWTITSVDDDTRAWTINGGDLIVGADTNIDAGVASAFTISTGLTAQLVDGEETATPVRGQLFISETGGVFSNSANVAAISVEGVASVDDGAGGTRFVNNLPDNFTDLPLADRIGPLQAGADVTIRGSVITSADGADGIVGTGGADLERELSVFLADNGLIQTSGADASAVSGGSYALTVLTDGNNSITTTGDGSGAILGTSGSNIINVIANDTLTLSTAGANAHGIVALGGDNNVSFFAEDSTVSISTMGDGAFGIGSVGDDSIVSVTMDGTSRVSTVGAGAHAILSDGAQSTLSATLTGDNEISTTGDGASAYFGPGRGSVTSFTTSGPTRITTTGENAPVFIIDDFDGSAASFDLNLLADRTQQSLLSSGTQSHLLSVTATAEGSSTLVFAATGEDSTYTGADLETQGAGAFLTRINLRDDSSSTGSFVNISAITRGAGAGGLQFSNGSDSDLTVFLGDSTLATEGINATALALTVGNDSILDVAVVDTAITTNADQSGGVALSAGDGSDLTFISTTSSITTAGSDAVGLLVEGSVGGTNDVNVGGTITTAGLDSHAVWLDRQVEDFELTGALSTTGNNADGIGADGSSFGIVTTADSSITTTGLDSDGIWIDYTEAPVGDVTDGSITVNGAITTSGNMADGIWVGYGTEGGEGGGLLAGGDITLGGTITTSGTEAYGIGATGPAMITLAAGSEILTSGTGSDGIWLDRRGVGNDVATLIDIDGLIRASGDDAHGVSVFYGADAPVNAGNAGTIEISGTVEGGGLSDASDGVRVYLDDGAATSITVESGGDVFAGGDANSRGIYLTALAGAGGTATANITIEGRIPDVSSGGNVFSANGAGIAEGNAGGGAITINTTLDIAGQVVVGGSDRVAIDLGTGTDTVVIREGGSVSGGIDLGADNDVISVAGSVRAFSVNAINTGTGDDELVIFPTATFTGDGGIDMGPGEDTLAFDGAAGTIGNVSLVADEVVFALDVQRIEKRGEGTWIFEGDDIPAGAIFEPAFLLNGTSRVLSQYLGIDTTVSASARLEGTGGVGNLVNAGTLAPGVDGVGTFTVAGDLTLQATSMLEIDIASDGTSDLVNAGDNVVIDGALAVNGVLYPTNFPLQQDYVIITALEDISGEFSSVTDNLPDVDVTVAYNDLDVTISYDRSQIESDKSIQANSVQAGLVDGRIFAETLRRRGVLMGATNGFVDAGGQQIAQTGDPAGLGSDGKRYAIWGAAIGALADVSGGGGRVGYDAGLGGLATGIDGFVPLDQGIIRVGIAAGFSTGNIDSDLSDADVDTIHIGAHGVYEKDQLGLSAAVSYGFQDYDIDRVIALEGAPNVTANGDVNGSVFSLSVGAKYTVYEADSIKVSPIAHVEHVSAKRNAYTETGAGILDLNVDAERFNRTFVGAGVRLEAESQSGSVTIRPQLDLMYEHAFGDDAAVVNSNVVNVQDATFTTRGGDQANNQVAVGAGFAIDISQRLSAHVRYDGNYGSGFTSHRGSAGLAWSF